MPIKELNFERPLPGQYEDAFALVLRDDEEEAEALEAEATCIWRFRKAGNLTGPQGPGGRR